MDVDSTKTKDWSAGKWVPSSSFLLVFKAHRQRKAQQRESLKVLELLKRNVGFHHFIFALKFNACGSRCGGIDPNTDNDTSVGIGTSIPAWRDRYLTFSTFSTAANFPPFHQRTDIFRASTTSFTLGSSPFPFLCRHVTCRCERSSQRDTCSAGDWRDDRSWQRDGGAQCGVILRQWTKILLSATWKYVNRMVKSVSINDTGPEFIGTGSKPNFAVRHTHNRKTRVQDKCLQENYCYFF